ncbi:MAG: hypothetical protein UV61_C0024G0016 [Candidatus Gottesmanbacteria bacterium GW2011_GWB1_43_11]|uniref:L,D-TPase catalytic domain-containing protein n=1 Tax=Candidatus Gottesmanbacteria bacterium GW2011_GWB1_43_11 TaxID=1618446 RepID=A0A0G1CGZ9_9BACT|nr:MAG: hypothetical protein UV04_C0018G0002 [Candidatus Gottesmanbacteria bacterium GW2011_GWA2_42_16]KKS54359.1 MAG: hypothetical protein UV17_C0020G0019 [Candidatus Gottesmanbacteria bacterium GW2011_GWA1_42_26]KKS80224.1 MAG: hypothetical protein UV55_C0045G0001 [Candidatus Gottesmanbacteria bacterium GW2011_GWC1_43_10]KKS84802.1 MAG: hypothetical protein UV61_C0024G0016 [Candidatus Gottesmanbacteria bacterium GW2011_GWB1_43_11]HCM37237.1 hypothetical protein [Patescibacteria group bacteriu
MNLAQKLLLGAALVFGGAYLYFSVLPYHFSPQYQPTKEDLELGGVYDKSKEHGTWHGQNTLSYYIPEPRKLAQVLGDTNGAAKRIEVDLTNQHVYAFEGDKKVFDFLISSGKWGLTPTGTFTIQYKTRSQLMKGGTQALGTYYYLPNVPYVQFFGNSEIPWSKGFSFHGTYWHNNFGHPMSHGCINMRIEDAEKLYYWATPELNGKASIKATSENPGTPVIIYGITPAS